MLDLFRNLEQFYPSVSKADTLLWHESEFFAEDFKELKYSSTLRLCDLNRVPDIWGRPFGGRIVSHSGFSPGYIRMMRFYAVTIWECFSLLGYEWVMR